MNSWPNPLSPKAGPHAGGERRLVRQVLFALLLLACSYRVWLVFHFNPLDHLWSDPKRHWDQGLDVLRSDPMSMVDPLLYQLYIGMLAKVTLKVPMLVAYWTSILSLLGPWLWYRFLRELLPSRDLALAGWVLLAAMPSWSALYSYFMQETLMLPLLGAALWATWRARRKGGVGPFVVAVLMWMLAGLTRGICLPLGMVALAMVWWQQGAKGARLMASLALCAALLGPLAWRMHTFMSQWSPYGVGTLVQLYQRSGAREIQITFQRGGSLWQFGFTSPAILRPPFEPLSSWISPRQGTASFLVSLDSADGWDAAKARLPEWTWDRAVSLTSDNLIHLFFSQSWPDTDMSRDIGLINHHLRWLWAPLTLLCVGLMWRRRHLLKAQDAILPAVLLTWFLVQGVFPLSVNEGRYRKPFEGLLIAQLLWLVPRPRLPSGVALQDHRLESAA